MPAGDHMKVVRIDIKRDEIKSALDSIAKDEDVKLFLAVERGRAKYLTFVGLEDALKTNSDRAKEIEPRQPIVKQTTKAVEVPQEEETQGEVESEGYEEQ